MNNRSLALVALLAMGGLGAALVALIVMGGMGAALAQQPEPRYLLAPLQAQRDRAANDAALCGGSLAQAQEEIAKLKAQIAELEKRADPK